MITMPRDVLLLFMSTMLLLIGIGGLAFSVIKLRRRRNERLRQNKIKQDLRLLEGKLDRLNGKNK